jgi:hypothetical protein
MQKVAKTIAQQKLIKDQLESPKHQHQTTFETPKFTQQTVFQNYLFRRKSKN